MNILEAVNKLQREDGALGAVTLGLYKKASAAQALGEELPYIAETITDNFFKAACDNTIEATTTRTWMLAQSLTKLAGTELDREILTKLAELAVNHGDETTSDEVTECYKLVSTLIK